MRKLYYGVLKNKHKLFPAGIFPPVVKLVVMAFVMLWTQSGFATMSSDIERNTSSELAQLIQGRGNGTVTDSVGEPVMGVTIGSQGTTEGTTTDADGAFSILASTGQV